MQDGLVFSRRAAAAAVRSGTQGSSPRSARAKHMNKIGGGIVSLDSKAPNMVELGLGSSRKEVDVHAEKVMRMCQDLFEDLQAGRRHRAECGLDQLPPAHVEETLGGMETVRMRNSHEESSTAASGGALNDDHDPVLTLEEEEELERFRHRLLAGIHVIRHSIIGHGHTNTHGAALSPSPSAPSSFQERFGLNMNMNMALPQGVSRRAEEALLRSSDGGMVLKLVPVVEAPGRKGEERRRRGRDCLADAEAAVAQRCRGYRGGAGAGGALAAWVGGGRGEWVGKRVIISGVPGRLDLENRKASCVAYDNTVGSEWRGYYRCILGIRNK